MTHRHYLVNLVNSYGWRLGAELGVARGLLMRRLLAGCPHLSMVGVDLFLKPHNLTQVLAIVQDYPDRCALLQCSTVEAANLVDDHSLDFAFIDAGHGYEAVSDDIRCWTPKIKPGGMLLGHDYCERHSGVIRAVNTAFGSDFGVLPFTIWSKQL